MNWLKGNSVTGAKTELDGEVDGELEQALSNFRQSVHAWSEAELSRPREARVAGHGLWRPVLAWGMGLAVALGAAGGGLYEHHKVVLERQARQEELAHQRQIEAQLKAKETDESLLANVDSDISRSVPTAMEPLAQLMDDDGTN